MDTGIWEEVRKYTKKKVVFVGKMLDGTETSFHWDSIPFDTAESDSQVKEMNDAVKDARGQKSKSYCNKTIKDILSPCDSYSSATNTFRFLEDTLVAVSGLHSGTRPLSTYRLFDMLSSIETITTLSVMQHTGLSERYCRTLATILKVASTELTRRLHGYIVDYQDGNKVSRVSKEQSRYDRIDYVQWFIEQQKSGLYEGLSVPR